MSDTRTLQAYADKVDDYAKLIVSKPSSHLRAFEAALPRGAAVLDLGCGPGNAAGWLATQGHHALATDASPEMIALAAAYPGVTAQLATFDDLTQVAEFDGIYANFSLLHLPKDAFAQALTSVKRALKPGGIFHLGLKQGKGSGRDHLGRYYSYYTEAELEGLLIPLGFTITQRSFGSGPGLAGTVDPWIILLTDG